MDSVTTPSETYYLPYEPPAPPPPRDPRVRRVLLVVTAVWTLLLAGTGIWYALHGPASAREQTTIASAEPVTTQAIEDVVRAAGTSVVPAVSGFDKVGDCDVTAARTGSRYRRQVSLYTPPGTEAGLLDRIAGNLPGRYRASTYHSPGGALHSLTADAGYWVAVTGSVTVPGLVTVKADTGCRTLGTAPAADPVVDPGPNPLGITGSWYAHALPCGLRTVSVAGPVGRPFSTLPRDGAVVATSDAYAARDGHAARRDAGTVTWTLTTGTCS
jgi:hypothetical protein